MSGHPAVTSRIGRGPRPSAKPGRAAYPASGFTLLELLLAIAIAALALTVAIPNFGPLLTRTQLYAATRDIASALRYTRGQALSRGRQCVFQLDVEAHRYRVSGRQRSYSIPERIQLSLFTAESELSEEGRGNIRFFPDGTSTGGRVTLEAGGSTRLVDVNWLTGDIVVREGDS